MSDSAATSTVAPPSEIPAQVKESLEKASITPEQYAALIQSGAVIPVAGAKLEELPPTLKSAVEEYARVKAQEAASITRDQLHPTLVKLQNDNAEVKRMIEEERKKAQEAEDQKRRLQDEEDRKKKTLEEQVELMRQESKRSMEEFAAQARAQIEGLERQLATEQLVALRERLISDAQGRLIADMVPDPKVIPVTSEQLQSFVEKAKIAYQELTQKAIEEYKAQQQQAATAHNHQGGLPSPGFPAMPSRTAGFPVVPSQTLPSQVNQPLDLTNVAKATRQELEKMKEEALRRFGF